MSSPWQVGHREWRTQDHWGGGAVCSSDGDIGQQRGEAEIPEWIRGSGRARSWEMHQDLEL